MRDSQRRGTMGSLVAACVLMALVGASASAEGTVVTKAAAPKTPALGDLERRQSVSQHGVTWTFDREAPVGQFVTGDWYVVGPVTVTGIDPAPRYGDAVTDATEAEKKVRGELARNGCVLNTPLNSARHGFDSRASKYDGAFHTKLPLAMKPGDALISSVSGAKSHRVSGGNSPIESFSVLTCVKAPLPADAFRPGYADRDQNSFLARNLRRDLLPNLPRPDDTPEVAKYAAEFARPWIDVVFFGKAATRYQHGGYGRGVCKATGHASLLLTLDFPAETKEPLLVNFVQYGIDLWSLVKSGYRGWPAHGGWGSGRRWPIVFAGVLLGEPRMTHLSTQYPDAAFQEADQVMHDDCWTGAGVVYTGHVGHKRAAVEEKTPLGWGPYEHLHPSRWMGWIGTSYRGNMTSNTWAGEALAIRILQAEDAWQCDAFLDYCDRWMHEPDPGYRNPYDLSKQGSTYDNPLFKAMWDAYREKLAVIGGKAGPARPPTGWKKARDLKSVPVEIGPHRALRVRGRPFLPVMIWAEHPGRIEDALAIGANVVAEGCFESPQNYRAFYKANVRNDAFLDALAAKGLYGVFGADMRVAGHPALLGWIHVDEPDAVAARAATMTDKELQRAHPNYRVMKAARRTGWPPELKDVPDHLLMVQPAQEWMKRADASRPVFLTVGDALLKTAADKPDVCADTVRQCDVIGCGAYPVAGPGSPAKVGEVARAVRTLLRLAPGKPVFAWIATRAEGEAAAIKPEHVRAQVWAAIIQGATGIGYRGFEGFKMDVRPDAEVMEGLKRLNARLAALAPAILAAPAKAKVAMTLEGDAAGHVKVTEHDGLLYVFAQNVGGEVRAGKAEFAVEGLKAGTRIGVVGEGRALTAEAGRFSDTLDGLAVHVYKMKL